MGGWYSAGTLTAHLSDGSAADFTDVSSSANGQFDRNYTLTYSARSAAQTLTVTWTLTSGNGNVTLNAAALQGSAAVTPPPTPAPALPASISASAGTPQTANVGTAFPAALQATVKDSNGNPLSGVTVAFTGPPLGASASFSTGLTATATTSSSGIATAPTLTANSQAGTYSVEANVAGLTAAATYNLTNTAPVSSTSGSLSDRETALLRPLI